MNVVAICFKFVRDIPPSSTAFRDGSGEKVFLSSAIPPARHCWLAEMLHALLCVPALEG